jgi:hypothetical protein
MSAAMTMQDLEHAELLPGRETPCVFNQSFSTQAAILSGNNVASGDNVSLINFGSQPASTTAVGTNISG